MADLLEELCSVAAGRLTAYGRALTGSHAAGEELAQEAVVRVFVRHVPFESLAACEAYVRTTMRRLHIDRIRHETVWRRVAAAQAVRGPVRDAADEVEAADAAGRALDVLAPRVRTAVVLHYLDDLPVAQVADTMHVSQGAVKRYLSDGRAALAQSLDAARERLARRVAGRGPRPA